LTSEIPEAAPSVFWDSSLRISSWDWLGVPKVSGNSPRFLFDEGKHPFGFKSSIVFSSGNFLQELIEWYY
jgi:hypothetical protein